MSASIAINRPTYDRLREAYDEAKTEGRSLFIFEGQEVLTAYAYYALRHMEDVLRITNDRVAQ